MNTAAEIKKHLELMPFQPFTVRMAAGREYRVPTIDHVYLPPGANGVIIADDKGVTVSIPARLLSGLVQPLATAENDPASKQE